MLLHGPGVRAEASGGEYLQLPGLIHMDSSISGGGSAPEELAAAARSSGAGYAFLTDHDTQRVSWGIPPFRKLFRITYSRDSVRSHGVERYLREVEEINRGMNDFLLLPGIEAVPYYTWMRGADGVLRLKHLHRHLLVLGLDRPEDMERLPSIETGYPGVYTRSSLAGLLWIAPLIMALYFITRTGGKAGSAGLARYGYWALFLCSALALADGYPYREESVDQYSPDRGADPYQQVIDYVNARGGLTFWAHPEAAWAMRMGETANPVLRFLADTITGGFSLETGPYPMLLNETRDYTGFAIFNEGSRTVGLPGGLWDDLLMQFCAGTRSLPVWAVAEQDLESGADPSAAGETRTVLMVREKTREECLDALRNGRMYCFTAFMDRKLRFREYAVYSGGGSALSGEVLPWNPDARLVLDLERTGPSLDLDVMVVRDGLLLDHRKIYGTERIEIPLALPARNLGYVRVVVYRGGTMVAATNPIFFSRGGAP